MANKKPGHPVVDEKTRLTERVRGLLSAGGDKNMGSRFLFRLTALAVAMAMVVLGAGVALADTIKNTLDATDDSLTVAAGSAADVDFYIHATASDGCDASDGSAVTVSWPSLPTGVTIVSKATPTSSTLTFSACGIENKKTATVRVAAGTAATTTPIEISPSGTDSDTADSYSVGSGKINLTVTAPTVTPSKSATTTTLSCSNVTYTGSAQTPCTASVSNGGTATISYQANTQAGTATATATFAETATHLGSTDTKNFTIAKAASTTTVTCTGSPTYDGTAKTPCSASATGPGGLNQTLTVSYTNNTNAGSATASASFPAGDNHLGSTDTKNFTIAKATTVTTMTCDSGPFYFTGSAITPSCSASVTGPAGLNESVSVSYANNVAVGSASAIAQYQGTSNYASSRATSSFAILAWRLEGFYRPIDAGVYNSVKGGHTVPLKFEVFAGSTELTDESAVASFDVDKVNCVSAQVDAVEEFATTGGTSLRYDNAGGQFVQNWKTPTGAGNCYKVTMTTQDGSSISALFKITK